HGQEIGRSVERREGGAVPSNDRQRLLDEAAGEGEHAGHHDHRHHGEVEAVHRTTPGGARGRDGRRGSPPSNRSTRSRRWRISRRATPPVGSRSLPRPRKRGTSAVVKPSLPASLRRASACPTGRTSPERPISPKITVSAGTGRRLKAETSAAATARSAAGSAMRKPPATLR